MMEESEEPYVYDIFQPINIGRRTGKQIFKRKNIKNGMDNFDDYFTESEAEQTLDVTPQVPVEVQEKAETLPPVTQNQSVSQVVKPLRWNPRIGRRTGRDLLGGKTDMLSSGAISFNDLLPDNEVSMSLNPTPDRSTLTGTKSSELSKEDDGLVFSSKDESHTLKHNSEVAMKQSESLKDAENQDGLSSQRSDQELEYPDAHNSSHCSSISEIPISSTDDQIVINDNLDSESSADAKVDDGCAIVADKSPKPSCEEALLETGQSKQIQLEMNKASVQIGDFKYSRLSSQLEHVQPLNTSDVAEKQLMKDTVSLNFGGDVTGSVLNTDKIAGRHFFGIKKRLSYSFALPQDKEEDVRMNKSAGSFLKKHGTTKVDRESIENVCQRTESHNKEQSFLENLPCDGKNKKTAIYQDRREPIKSRHDKHSYEEVEDMPSPVPVGKRKKTAKIQDKGKPVKSGRGNSLNEEDEDQASPVVGRNKKTAKYQRRGEPMRSEHGRSLNKEDGDQQSPVHVGKSKKTVKHQEKGEPMKSRHGKCLSEEDEDMPSPVPVGKSKKTATIQEKGEPVKSGRGNSLNEEAEDQVSPVVRRNKKTAKYQGKGEPMQSEHGRSLNKEDGDQQPPSIVGKSKTRAKFLEKGEPVKSRPDQQSPVDVGKSNKTAKHQEKGEPMKSRHGKCLSEEDEDMPPPVPVGKSKKTAKILEKGEPVKSGRGNSLNEEDEDKASPVIGRNKKTTKYQRRGEPMRSERGSRLNKEDGDQQSPVHVGKSKKTAKHQEKGEPMKSRHGKCLSEEDDDQQSPVPVGKSKNTAKLQEKGESVKSGRGKDMSEEDEDRPSPVHVERSKKTAKHQEKGEPVKSRHGKCPSEEEEDQQTPLHVVKSKNVVKLQKREPVKSRRGKHLSEEDEDQQTPVHVNKSKKTAKLQEEGEPVKSRHGKRRSEEDEDQQTPLHVVKSKKVVKLQKQEPVKSRHGKHLSEEDEDQQTPVHVNKSKKTAKLQEEGEPVKSRHGKRRSEEDEDQQTPLHVVKSKKVVKLQKQEPVKSRHGKHLREEDKDQQSPVPTDKSKKTATLQEGEPVKSRRGKRRSEEDESLQSPVRLDLLASLPCVTPRSGPSFRWSTQLQTTLRDKEPDGMTPMCLPTPSSSLVHYHEVTTSVPPSPAFSVPDLSHKIIRPDISCPGLRRSTRTRVKRLLNTHKGEAVVYRRDSTGIGLIVDSIKPSIGEAKMKAKEVVQRQRRRQRRLQRLHVPAVERKKRLSIHYSVKANSPVDSHEAELDPETPGFVARKQKELWVSSDLTPLTGTESLAVCVQLQQPGFDTGEIHLGALAEKPYTLVVQTLVFNVIYGKLRVRVNHSSTVVESGDDFFVPKGSSYSIKNLRRDVAKLHFINLSDAQDRSNSGPTEPS